jgi:hypothetical protein
LTKPKFTPGPLVPWIKGNTIEVQDSKGKSVIKWPGFDSCDFDIETQKANANLFASSPELYRELEDMIELLKDLGVITFSKLIVRIEELLAKVRGESE